MKSVKQQEESLANLREWVKPGDTIYTVVRSVSRSGMSRRIDVMKFEGGRKTYLTTSMANLHIAGMRMSINDWRASKGAAIPGCGMDMGFHAVDSLCYKLFGKSMSDSNIQHEWI